MTAVKGERAIYNAAKASSCSVGLCLRYVRTWYNIGPRYASAYSAWRNAKKRHTTFPPQRGYPVFFSGGSQSFGHIALSLGGDMVRSTDWPSAGMVGNARIRDISAKWNMTYLGWTTDLNGVSVWCPTVDLSKIQHTADNHPSSYGYGTKRVEYRLWKQKLLPFFRINGYWAYHQTGDAWKQWCAKIGVPVSRIPSSRALKALARRDPYFIVRP